MTIYLETARLRLRGWRQDGLDPFAALNADDKVMKYFSAPYSREQSDALVARTQQSLQENGFGFYAVEEISTRGFIGFIGLSRIRFSAAFAPAVETGWRFQPGDKASRQRPQPPVLKMGFRPLGCAKLCRSHRTRINRPSP
jgi:RimJ/RimL family protein N-acetyltransferase